MVSCLNVSLQITENCLYADTKKTEIKVETNRFVRWIVCVNYVAI